MRFGFVGPTYSSESTLADAQRCVNLYPEVIESGVGKSKIALYSTPGLTSFVTLPTAPVRGLWAGEDRLFAAAGDKLYEVFSDATYTDLGNIGDDSSHSPVQMFPNGLQLFIVSAGMAFLHDGTTLHTLMLDNGSGTVDTAGTAVTWITGDQFDDSMVGQNITINGSNHTVASVTDATHLVLATSAGTQTGASFAATVPLLARTGAFLDGYFVAAKPDSKQFYISALNNGLVWDALDFASKEGYPDNISSILADHEELWLFGTHKSTEVWRNEGDPDFPFRRDPGAFIHNACPAPWSVVSMADGVYWLGGDTRGRLVAYRAQGFQPVRVSNHAIEQVWAGYATVSDAYAWTYTDNGHTFWMINFLTAGATWCYDAATNMWHERGWWNGSSITKHRGRCGCYVFAKHLIGDHTTGVIYQMSTGVFADAGTAIHRYRTAPHIADENVRVFHSALTLDTEVGSGAPTYTLEVSNDGGRTFGSPKAGAPSLSTNLGRVIWRRLGKARDRVYRVSTTASVRIAITDAYLEVTGGQS